MAWEIEKKYLVDEVAVKRLIEENNLKSNLIIQGYLKNSEDGVVRVRVSNNNGYLTIKSKNIGIKRKEFEYEIPENEASEMLFDIEQKIIKERFVFEYFGKKWEIDFFLGKLQGLIIAEIELESEDEEFEKPHWLLEDVSEDQNYFNNNLIKDC